MLAPQMPGGTKVRQVVSAQRILSCNSDGLGCAGGSVYAAFKSMMDAAGVFFEEAYPYAVQCWSGDLQSVAERSSLDDQRCADATWALVSEPGKLRLTLFPDCLLDFFGLSSGCSKMD